MLIPPLQILLSFRFVVVEIIKGLKLGPGNHLYIIVKHLGIVPPGTMCNTLF